MARSRTAFRGGININSGGAAAVAVGYAVVGALWIFFSDRILDAAIGSRPHLLSQAQTLKGWIFVAVTAASLYLVLASVLRTRGGSRAGSVMDRRFAAMVDSLREHSIAMLDTDGRVQSWSAASERITLYSADEMIGQPISRLYAPDDEARGEPARLLAEAAAHGQVEIEGWRMRKDGSRYWASGVTTAIRNEDGTLLGFATAARDLTERRRTFEALRASEARLRDFVECGSDWFWETDADLRFTYVSDRFESASGLRREQWEGRRRDEIPTAAHDRETAARLMEHMRARRSFRNVQYVFVDSRGRTHTALTSGKPVFDAEGAFRGYRGAGVDITAGKSMEAQLRQSQKMEAVGQLTGGIAHDFNNLLSVIHGSVELLEEGLPADSRLRELAGDALTASKRGAELTHRLLAFARRQPLAPAVTDLNGLIVGMSQLLQRTLGATIEVETVLTAGLWKTLVDPGLIENALFNLALNARDAMPEGGRITIETGNVRLSEEYAAENIDAEPGRYVMVALTDSGAGMAPEVRERAFEPFFTTKAPGKGTGLGLSMVYGLVRQSGGHIKIYSEIGRGTTVRVYLPFTDAGAGPVDLDRAAGLEPTGTGEMILLVEDDEAVRRNAFRLVRSLNYRVLEAASGHVAAAIFTRNPAIDLLLTDMVLPDAMSGAELASTLRANRPDLPVVFMSGYTENALRDATANEVFIAKPFTKADIARALHRALAAGGGGNGNGREHGG
jgi:PAS domain S-box-containing protein